MLLRVHTHVREDTLALFGFMTTLEQQIFERLIAVSGIGPKLALAVLSGIEARDLVRAVQLGDSGAADDDPGHRQEDGRADHARAEGPAGEARSWLPAGRGRRRRQPTSDAARRPAVGALQSGISSAACGAGGRRGAQGAGDESFESRLKQALRELAR